MSFPARYLNQFVPVVRSPSRLPFAGVLAVMAACAPPVALARPSATPAAAEARYFAATAAQSMGIDAVASELATADFVFFGEQHDDPATHRAELALLAAIGAERSNVVLSLEMFERDVQNVVDDYLAGRIAEKSFLEKSRPWPRYSTDYRALVELARARGWPIVAANIPRRLASAVGKAGLKMLDTLNATDRGFVAQINMCPADGYRDRFAASMQGHGNGVPNPTAADTAGMGSIVQRFYEAQCAKDEAMAESIVLARQKNPDAIVVHFNGAFHSDYKQGTAARVSRRIPSARVKNVTAIPVEAVATAQTSDHKNIADYIIFTPKPPK